MEEVTDDYINKLYNEYADINTDNYADKKTAYTKLEQIICSYYVKKYTHKTADKEIHCVNFAADLICCGKNFTCPGIIEQLVKSYDSDKGTPFFTFFNSSEQITNCIKKYKAKTDLHTDKEFYRKISHIKEIGSAEEDVYKTGVNKDKTAVARELGISEEKLDYYKSKFIRPDNPRCMVSLDKELKNSNSAYNNSETTVSDITPDTQPPLPCSTYIQVSAACELFQKLYDETQDRTKDYTGKILTWWILNSSLLRDDQIPSITSKYRFFDKMLVRLYTGHTQWPSQAKDLQEIVHRDATDLCRTMKKLRTKIEESGLKPTLSFLSSYIDHGNNTD